MKILINKCLQLLVFISLLSCSSVQISELNNDNIVIMVEHNRKNDSWNVSYKLPKKVKALVFNRQTNTFRHKNWKIKTQGLELKLIADQEYIVSTTDTEFDQLELTHKSYYEFTPKDYEFFFEYADGDVLMYSGHYDVFPLYQKLDLKKGLKDLSESGPKSEYKLRPVSGEKVVILGNVYTEKEVRWIDKKGRGTYIYWGNTAPLDTKHLVVVVDRKVPEWLASEVKKNLPKLFDFYNKKTGVILNFKPVVFLSYAGEEEEGYSNTGGTLPGLIQLTLRGKDWKKKGDETFEYLFKFLAHEAAHLWNGQMFNSGDGKHSWMHEGGADAFAYRAMKELKVFSKERYLEFINASLNKCILGLDGSYPLVESSKKRSFKNYYYCGSTIGLLTELSLIEGNLFTFWSTLFQNAKTNKNKYSDEMYLNELERRSGNIKILGLLKKLIYGPIGNTGSLLKELFGELKVKTGPLKASKKNMAKRIALNFLSQIYKNDCDGSINLTRKKEFYLIHGSKNCKTFKNDFKVSKAGNYHIFANAEKAYEYARRSCSKKGSINLLNSKSKTIRVSCNQLLGPYNFFEIRKL